MAAGRIHVNANMAVLLQKEDISAEDIEALLCSNSTLGGFQDSRSAMKFEDVCTNVSSHSYFHRCEMEGEQEMEGYLHQKKRRLAAKQVQFLERSFEVENKLDPDRKIQLARELDLQPRQVAIWFQNRRARWKTKQLEKDFDNLKENYNSLMAEYEKLVNEKERLQSEVTHLTNKLLLKGNGKDVIKLEESTPPEATTESAKMDKTMDAPLLSSFKHEDQAQTTASSSTPKALVATTKLGVP
ncbi:hypothetical protein HPP92_019632 [Vanilla planifolia]|uniref:Homeobox-leucine zipper protein n=1 Tax=Vanilla planifolia TaxID=51239 RepID=A0A835QAP5_VANPL|nr:hypothetical protein HPP92_019632 [Vanilla planifolia]